MKIILSAFAYILVLIGMVHPGFAAAGHPEPPALGAESTSANLGYHLAAASHLEQDVEPLEAKIRNLIRRAQTYREKPYLDPKELHRNAIKRQLGNLLKDLSELKQNIAMHRELADQIMEARKRSTERLSDRPSVLD